MPAEPSVPYHYVITVTLLGSSGGASGASLCTYEGVVMWRGGETRQDQYAKVTQAVNTDLRASGHTQGFVTTAWSLDPNER